MYIRIDNSKNLRLLAKTTLLAKTMEYQLNAALKTHSLFFIRNHVIKNLIELYLYYSVFSVFNKAKKATNVEHSKVTPLAL